MRVFEKALALLFPGDIYCISCQRPMQPGNKYALCQVCIRRLSWACQEICGICGRPLGRRSDDELCSDCQEGHRNFDRGYTCMRYGFQERKILHRFKYSGKSYYAPYLADILADRLAAEKVVPDVLIPVPMHLDKKKERGYNQAQLLAVELGRLIGLPVETKLLWRRETTESMSRLSLGDRRRVNRDLYGFHQKGRSLVQGKNLLLIDDVFTTGSTVDACSRLLREANPKKIWVATVFAGRDPFARKI